MNSQFGMCPRCKQDVPNDRLNDNPVVCPHCGWTKPHDGVVETQIFKSYLKITVSLSVAAVLIFTQVVKWDSHALSVLPLQLKSVAGMLSPSDHQEFVDICSSRNDWPCVEKIYQSWINNYPEQNEARAKLGQLQYKLGSASEAVKTFAAYFQNGGVDLEASYVYARALSATGQVDQAAVAFQKVLEAKPETLQVTVVQHYVKMLIDNSRGKEAFGVIDSIRKNGGSASLFMDKEYNDLKVQMN